MSQQEFAREYADIDAAFKFLSPTPIRIVWHQDQAGLIPNSCPGSAYYYDGGGAPSSGESSDSSHGGAGAGTGDDSRHRGQVSEGVHSSCAPCLNFNEV